jgi:transcription termination factor Rho
MFESCKLSKFLLNTNCLEEDFVKGDKVMNVGMFEGADAVLRRFNLVFANALNRAYLGEDVAIFVSDFTTLPKVFMEGMLLGEGVDTNALNKAKKLFASSKCFVGGGSLTVVVGLNTKGFCANIINAEILEIASIVI